MAAAPRITVTLSKPSLAWLNAEAARLEVTVSELLRRIVDKEREA